MIKKQLIMNNYDFYKLIQNAFKIYPKTTYLHKCYFVRAAKEANAQGYEYKEFFIHCNSIITELISTYETNLYFTYQRNKIKNYDNAKQKKEHKERIEHIKKRMDELAEMIDKDTYSLNSDLDYEPIVLPIELSHGIIGDTAEHGSYLCFTEIVYLKLGLQEAEKELMAAAHRADEAKHYNYTLTPEQQQNMFNELIKNGYIAPDTDFNSFCFAISGTPIKTEFVPINWQTNLRDLCYFIDSFFTNVANVKASNLKAVYCFRKKDGSTIGINSFKSSARRHSKTEPPSAAYFRDLKKQIDKSEV